MKSKNNRISFLVSAGITESSTTFGDTDLLVLTVFQNTLLGEGPSLLDSELHGALTREIGDHAFKGELGEQLLLDTSNLSNSRIKKVLILGLGKSDTWGQPVICAAYKRMLEVAGKTGAKRLTIPVFPNRLTGKSMSLSAMFAVFACRLLQSTPASEASLDEVEIVCTQQAKRHIESGLKDPCQLCATCADPCLPRVRIRRR